MPRWCKLLDAFYKIFVICNSKHRFNTSNQLGNAKFKEITRENSFFLWQTELKHGQNVHHFLVSLREVNNYCHLTIVEILSFEFHYQGRSKFLERKHLRRKYNRQRYVRASHSARRNDKWNFRMSIKWRKQGSGCISSELCGKDTFVTIGL